MHLIDRTIIATLYGIALLAAVILVLSYLAQPADAQELQVSSGLACDTPEQVKQVIMAADKDAAFALVNAGSGSPPCTVALYVYTVTREVEQVRTPDGLASILEVVLHRASLDNGMTMFNSKRLTLFMPFLIQAAMPSVAPATDRPAVDGTPA